MLSMIGKGIRGGTCHTIHHYVKTSNKFMKNYDKNKESLYLNYRDTKKLHGWPMSQKLPLGSFKWVENTSKFSKDFLDNYNEDSDEGYFLEVDVRYLEELHELHNNLPCLPERMKIA